jgi:hypothetical protein
VTNSLWLHILRRLAFLRDLARLLESVSAIRSSVSAIQRQLDRQHSFSVIRMLDFDLQYHPRYSERPSLCGPTDATTSLPRSLVPRITMNRPDMPLLRDVAIPRKRLIVLDARDRTKPQLLQLCQRDNLKFEIFLHYARE